jgi:thiamine biosynthesis lipoprotein
MLYEFDAIGTHWWLERLDGEVSFPDSAKREMDRYTRQFDQYYSRFRNDSLVAELARTGRLKNPPAEMLDMLEYAKQMLYVTECALDPLVGNDLQTLGYGHIDAKKAGRVKKYPFLEAVTWNEDVVRVPKGTILEFGGFGKGWLIDAYVKILRKHGVQQFIVNGGGDLFCQSKKTVEFELQNPYDPTLKVGEAGITTGALAASSVVIRAWEHDGVRYHHIIDPETALPSDSGVVATFVVAETALLADTLATALVIRPELNEKFQHDFQAKTVLLARDPKAPATSQTSQTVLVKPVRQQHE